MNYHFGRLNSTDMKTYGYIITIDKIPSLIFSHAFTVYVEISLQLFRWQYQLFQPHTHVLGIFLLLVRKSLPLSTAL